MNERLAAVRRNLNEAAEQHEKDALQSQANFHAAGHIVAAEMARCTAVLIEAMELTAKKGPGRPPGSKNRAKVGAGEHS